MFKFLTARRPRLPLHRSPYYSMYVYQRTRDFPCRSLARSLLNDSKRCAPAFKFLLALHTVVISRLPRSKSERSARRGTCTSPRCPKHINDQGRCEGVGSRGWLAPVDLHCDVRPRSFQTAGLSLNHDFDLPRGAFLPLLSSCRPRVRARESAIVTKIEERIRMFHRLHVWSHDTSPVRIKMGGHTFLRQLAILSSQ